MIRLHFTPSKEGRASGKKSDIGLFYRILEFLTLHCSSSNWDKIVLCVLWLTAQAIAFKPLYLEYTWTRQKKKIIWATNSHGYLYPGSWTGPCVRALIPLQPSHQENITKMQVKVNHKLWKIHTNYIYIHTHTYMYIYSMKSVSCVLWYINLS